MAASELSDSDVFGSPELSDQDVFGAAPPAPSGDAVNQLKQVAAKGMAQQAQAANEEKPWYQKAAEGYGRGAEQGGVGILQAIGSSDIGANALNKVGINQEDLQDVAKNLEMQGKGTGIAGTIGETIGNPVNDAALAAMPAGIAGRAALGVAQGALQPVTDSSQRGVNSAISGVLNAVVPLGINPTVSGVGKLAQMAVNRTGLSDLAGTIAEKLGSNPTMSDLYQAAKQTGLNIKGKSPQEIKDNLQAWLSNNTQGMISRISGKDFDPIDANVAISKNYATDKAVGSQKYNAAQALGEGQTIPIPAAAGFKDNLNNLIDDLQSRKQLSLRQSNALAGLQNIQKNVADKITPAQEGSILLPDEMGGYSNNVTPQKVETQDIGYNDLVDLDKTLNEGFDASSFPNAKSHPYAVLKGITNDALNEAANQTPQFGTALNDAKDYWRENVAKKYTDNELLGKFWKPEDYYESLALTNKGSPLSGELRERANSMLDKIDTPEKMEALENALPQQQAEALRAEKFNQILKDTGFDASSLADPRKYALVQKAIAGKPELQRTLYNMRVVLADLNLRGLDNSMSDNVAREALEGSKSAQEAFKAVYSAAVGKRRYSLSHAAQAIFGKEGPTGQALKGFQKGIQAGAPFKKTIATGAKNIAPFIGSAGALTAEDAIEQ